MKRETKRFLVFLLFLFAVCGLGVWAGYSIANAEHDKKIVVLSEQVNKLIAERDSLLDSYNAGDIILQKTLDNLRAVNADRKMWKQRYYDKIREPLPTNSTELEKQIYELLKLLNSEVLPD